MKMHNNVEWEWKGEWEGRGGGERSGWVCMLCDCGDECIVSSANSILLRRALAHHIPNSIRNQPFNVAVLRVEPAVMCLIIKDGGHRFK